MARKEHLQGKLDGISFIQDRCKGSSELHALSTNRTDVKRHSRHDQCCLFISGAGCIYWAAPRLHQRGSALPCWIKALRELRHSGGEGSSRMGCWILLYL